MWSCRWVLVAVWVVLVASLAQGAEPAGGERLVPYRPKTESQIIAELMDKLTGPDAAARRTAIEAIKLRMNTRGLNELRTTWLRAMIKAKLYQEAADLAWEGVLNYPWETRSVETVLTHRVDALLALGKPQEALAAAKSLFNVASMGGTSDAILKLAECLNAARPEEKDVFVHFRDEQIAGAATQPAKGARSGPTVMSSIKVEATPYLEALKKLTGEDYQSLLGRGNLLLMADRGKEAREIFERMYSLAGTDLVESSEAIARSMKAEDGSIGRANTWVLSIRPKK